MGEMEGEAGELFDSDSDVYTDSCEDDLVMIDFMQMLDKLIIFLVHCFSAAWRWTR